MNANKSSKELTNLVWEGAMTKWGEIFLYCSMLAMGMYKLFKIGGGAKSIVGPPPQTKIWGGPVPLVSTGSGPHAPFVASNLHALFKMNHFRNLNAESSKKTTSSNTNVIA